MKIAIDIRELNETAGMKKVLVSLLEGLFLKDEENIYYLLGEESKLILPFNLSENFKYVGKRFLNINIWTHFFVPIFLWKNKIDVYFNPTNSHTPLIIPCKYVWMLHDLISINEPDLNSSDKKRQDAIILGVRCADIIVTPSENSKKDILKAFNLDENKICVIHNSLSSKGFNADDKEKFKKIKDKYNLFVDFLLCVGLLEPRKNIEFVLDVFSCLIKREKYKDIKIVLVEDIKKITSNIREKIKSLGIIENVVFTGYVFEEDLPYIYKNAKIFLYPTLFEGFGMPVLEAMSVGVPLICSDRSSLPEVVGNGGILLDPTNKDKWIDTIINVLEDNRLREELILKGEKQAAKFSWDVRIDKFIKVLTDGKKAV